MTATAKALDAVRIIERKRDGDELEADEISALIEGYVDGRVPDYQMAAWAMAVVFRGLTPAETLALTRAMVRSGDRFDLGAIGRRIVDKHSTGGVGDKVSLALAPIVAACGVPFAKMSGRGLGHTGGTLDKLESISGFRVELEHEAFIEQVREVGVAIIGQTGQLVPADKQLYALRDVTGTIESIPLIAASIMSKKLAAGADAIVLDVKVGRGAFMKSMTQARELADAMIQIGRGAGREVRVMVSDMSAPLGRTVGNGLEIREVLDLLGGGGPADLREAVLTAAALLLEVSDLELDHDEGLSCATDALTSGAARKRFDAWIAAQGGDLGAGLPAAPVQHEVAIPYGGIVTRIDALTVGRAAADLGAGRQVKGDEIDHAVGVELHKSVGEAIEDGEKLLTVHARTELGAQRAADSILGGTEIDHRPDAEPFERSVVLELRS